MGWRASCPATTDPDRDILLGDSFVEEAVQLVPLCQHGGGDDVVGAHPRARASRGDLAAPALATTKAEVTRQRPVPYRRR
jgi:hypothetical protein